MLYEPYVIQPEHPVMIALDVNDNWPLTVIWPPVTFAVVLPVILKLPATLTTPFKLCVLEEVETE